MVDATRNPDARERDDAGCQLHRKRDRPFAFVVARARWPLPCDELDVAEHRFAVESLADVDSTLSTHADRPVVEEVTKKPRECERPLPSLSALHAEHVGTSS